MPAKIIGANDTYATREDGYQRPRYPAEKSTRGLRGTPPRRPSGLGAVFGPALASGTRLTYGIRRVGFAPDARLFSERNLGFPNEPARTNDRGSPCPG